MSTTSTTTKPNTMHYRDVQALDEARAALYETHVALFKIDLRHYRYDEDLKSAIREWRQQVAALVVTFDEILDLNAADVIKEDVEPESGPVVEVAEVSRS